jgi:lysophospholipase L1-like esterase
VVAGLPANLGKVIISWWNGNTSFDENFSSWGSYGRPSEYYIEASTDGVTWTTLDHKTGNYYNGRQFYYDFTGLGYTQVRLRVLSIVGVNAGNDVVSVFRADSGPNDTYLLLGDSITSNCWAAANDGFPNEQLATQINALRPDHFPAVAEAGIPSQTSGSILGTSTYGVPAIQQWLNDFPTVRYVGLSYGTNDANGNIPAATYYANMTTLVQDVIAAGKIPVIPTIVSSPAANVQTNAPAMNTYLSTLESLYPSIIPGPDLWSVFQGHSTSDGWFFDSLHPSLGTGCNALQSAWTNTMIAALYPLPQSTSTAPTPNVVVVPVNGPIVSSTSSRPSMPISTTTPSANANVTFMEQLKTQLKTLFTKMNTSLVSQLARNLALGSSGTDVRALQVFLNSNGYAISGSGAGSSGHETDYFGNATAQALRKFQRANGLTIKNYFNAATRAFLLKNFADLSQPKP